MMGSSRAEGGERLSGAPRKAVASPALHRGDEPSIETTLAELERAKAAAEAANEAKTRYLVSVSHEIRSPLNAIYGYAQLLERGGAIPGAEAGAVIRRSAEHLTNLVDSLLEISRIESGVIKLQFEPVEIRQLLDQLFRMAKVQAEAKGLFLKLEISPRLPKCVKADEKRLRQILINLVSNAIKYTNQGGVTVTVGYRSQIIDVAVTDSGIGLSPDELGRVFEPFERGSSPEVQLQPGIGLGLAITRLLTRVMGGDVTATSELGVGSTFRLKMMLPEPATAPLDVPQDERISGYEGDPRTVLVIDDDPAQVTVLQSFLRPLGFVVYTADNGLDGLALAAHCSADIVLLDVQMPGLNGWQTAAQLRAAHGRPLKIVMVSANVHEMHGPEDRSASHDSFVAKPVDLHPLLKTIGSLLGLRWTAEKPAGQADGPAVAGPLPAQAAPVLTRLRHSTRIGHVRGIEEGLRDLRAAAPAAEGLLSTLQQQLRDLDLRAFGKTLDDAQR